MIEVPDELLRYDKQKAKAFMLAFARLEYALKENGYRKGQSRRMDVNWKRVAQKVGDQNPALKKLFEEAPKFLGTDSNWKSLSEIGRWAGLSAAEKQIECLKQVRNNLFHGSKDSRHLENDRSRNDLLMDLAGQAIGEILDCLTPVRETFHGK